MKWALVQLKSDLRLHEVKKNSISSIFIGGGTPSCVDASLYKDFFETLSPYLVKNPEITSEANPNSASKEWLSQMKEFGVNRISFGVQSFLDEKLKLLGRKHRANEAIKAIENANSLDYENISLDFMYATYLDTEKSVKEELKKAISLPINHISAYSLTLEENTPFFKTPQVQKDDERIAHIIANTLNENNLPQYEVSNYGNPCKHNMGYWQRKPYLGIGAGAVGFFKDFRYYPKVDIKEYIKNPLEHKKEILSKDDIFMENLFLGLRSKIGVHEDIFTPSYKEKLITLVKENKLTHKTNRYFCYDYFLADEIVLYLLS